MNNLIKSIQISDNNQYIMIDFNEPLFNDLNGSLQIENFILLQTLGTATLLKRTPDLVYKQYDQYIIVFSLEGTINGEEVIKVVLQDVFNVAGKRVYDHQIGNQVHVNKPFTPTQNKPSSKNTEISLKKEQPVSEIKKQAPCNKYSIGGSSWFANKTIVQANPGLAYKLNLKKYHAQVAAQYPKFYGQPIKKYPPQYTKTSFDRIYLPQVVVTPLT
jgi:hypothetical protein